MGTFLEGNSVTTVSPRMLDSSGKGGTDAVNKGATVGVFTSQFSFALCLLSILLLPPPNLLLKENHCTGLTCTLVTESEASDVPSSEAKRKKRPALF